MPVTDLVDSVVAIRQRFVAVPIQYLTGLPPNFEFMARQFSTTGFTKSVITVVVAAAVIAHS